MCPRFVTLAAAALLATSATASAQETVPSFLDLMEPLAAALEDDTSAATIELEATVGSMKLPQGKDPLSFVASWSALLKRRYQSSKERVWGTGRVVDETLVHEEKGRTILFEYAFRLPEEYDHEKAWPVVLCLHDEGGDGETYLDEIWSEDDAAEAFANQVILVAPTIEDETPSRRVGRRRRSVSVPLERFNRHHSLAMILPLMEICRLYNADPARIFVEGVGRGAQDALQLGALYGIELFAGAVGRNGFLRNAALAPGLERIPCLVTHRVGEGPPEAVLANHEEAKVVTFEAPERLSRSDLAGGETDPMAEASPAIGAFYLKHARPAYPDDVRLVTNNAVFRKRAWLMVTRHDIHAGELVDIHARLDREKGLVEVESEGVYSFTVFLNDEMLDLDRPVIVRVNGETRFEGEVERSFDYMVRQMRLMRPGETDRVYTAFVRVKAL